jgi:hypothetical protein
MASINKSKLKKSQGFEAWFFVIIVLLAFSLFFVVLNKIWGDVKEPLDEGLSNAMPDNSPVNISTTLNQVTSAGLQFDKLIPLILIGLFGFILISAGAIIKHPIMIFVGIIILGVVILISVIFSNLYNEITSSDGFSNTKADMPVQDLLMHYLPAIVVIMAVVIMAALLLTRGSGGAGGL